MFEILESFYDVSYRSEILTYPFLRQVSNRYAIASVRSIISGARDPILARDAYFFRSAV